MTILLFANNALHTDSFAMINNPSGGNGKPVFSEKVFKDPEGYFILAALGLQLWLSDPKQTEKLANNLREALRKADASDEEFLNNEDFGFKGEYLPDEEPSPDENNLLADNGLIITRHSVYEYMPHVREKLRRVTGEYFKGSQRLLFDYLSNTGKSPVEAFSILAKHLENTALPIHSYKQSDLLAFS